MRIPTFYQFQFTSSLISQQFNTLNQLVVQSITGDKIQSSSQDPVLGSQIKSEATFISDMQNYFDNGVIAQARLQLFTATAQNSISVVSDIQSQISKAQGGILTPDNKLAIAQQLQGDLSLLLNYANTTDVNGAYIFGGYNSNTPPYVLSGGAYQYQGGPSRTYVEIGQNVSVMYYECGFNVFGDIFNGNGTFTINAASGNTGSASSSAGSVVDPGSYVPDTYTLTFVTNSAGQLAYQVVGASSGQVIPPPPATIPNDAPAYNPKGDITFNGINFTIDGQPNVGDVFTIQPSTRQNIFNSLQNLINTLESSAPNEGIYNQTLTQISAGFSQILSHLTVYQSDVGTIAASVNNQINDNQTIITNANISLSGLQDAPLEQVYSQLLQKQLALEASTQSYLKLQQTLMQIMQL